MPKKEHKVRKHFRLTPQIAAGLENASRLSGFDETRIVEDALVSWLSGGFEDQREKVVRLSGLGRVHQRTN